MLTTSRYSLKKPQTSDASTALRTSISDNADILDPLLDGRGYAEVLTDQGTSSSSVVDLTTAGPSVTLTVPTNGLVAVRATAEVGSGTIGNGLVRLFEDAVELGTILTTTSGDSGAKHTFPGSIVGIIGAVSGGWLVFPAAAGSHVYKMRYSSPAAQATAFKNRKLWVRVLTF